MTEEININSISKDDLPWIIEYDSDRCMLCGHCVAACSFGAIKVDVQKRKKVRAISNEEGFQIDEDQKAIPVIRQVIDANNFCRGCGICTKVCPNGAIKVVRNQTEIFGTRYRAKTSNSVKRTLLLSTNIHHCAVHNIHIKELANSFLNLNFSCKGTYLEHILVLVPQQRCLL